MPSEEEKRPPWAQLPGETPLWFGRFERYRLMWPHSIVEVYRDEWRAARQKTRQTEQGEIRGNQRIDSALEADMPKEASGPWYDMAKKYRWSERASAWDAHQVALIEENTTAERTLVLATNYAQMHRRIATLNTIAEQLFAMTKDPAKVWMPDVKAIGSGPEAERVDLVQFNAALYHEIRACLDDIASELGERVKRKETKITILPKSYLESAEELDDDGVER